MSIDLHIDRLKEQDVGVVKNAQQEIIKFLTVSEAQKLLSFYTSSDDFLFKQNILHTFVQSPDSQYSDMLIKTFQTEKNEDLKFLISIALGKCGNEKIINHLITLFKRNDFLLCHKVMYVLKSIGKSEPLIDMLNKTSGQMLYYIKETLKKIDNKKPEKLYSIISKENKELTENIFEILGTVRSRENVIKLLSYLEKDEPFINRCAAEALFIVGEAISEFLGAELKRENISNTYMEYIPEILSRHGDRGQKILRDIIMVENTPEYLIFNILKYIDFHEDIVEKIIFYAQNTSIKVKMQIANTLSRFGDKASAHFYKILFTSEDKNVKAVLLAAFLGNENINQNIINEVYSLEEKEIVKVLFKYVLSEIRPGNAINVYFDLLKSKDYFDREIAKDIIENLEIDNYKYVLESMGTSNTGIGAILIDIFKKNKNKIKGMLLTYLKEGTDSLKISSAFLIGELKLEDSVDELVNATKDGNDWVRKYAYKAIVNIKGESEAKNIVPDFDDSSGIMF